MFDIISRLRPITLDCFTTNVSVLEHYPVVKANKMYPEWWKSLESTSVQPPDAKCPFSRTGPTIKVCDGFLDLYKTMITIPLWSDLMVKTDGNKGIYWHSAAPDMKIEHHPVVQYNHPDFFNYCHMKILMPWLIEEKVGVNFQLFHSDWNMPANWFKYRILGGVLNYKYQGGAHCNMMLPNIPAEFILPAGEPIMNLLPLTDRKVVIKTHLLGKTEYDQKQSLISYPHTFMGRYKTSKKLRSK